MNARERFLAVYDEKQRKKLDRVPTHVQYIREEFIELHENALKANYNGQLFDNNYFDIPLILGFDAIFAPIPSCIKVKSVIVEDDKGERVRIGESGEALITHSTYYQGGYVRSMEILDQLRTNLRKIHKNELIRKTILRFEKIAPLIFPVLTVDGIFDRVWKSMGMTHFSLNFRKKTKLYNELIKFYAEITRLKIEGLIEATSGRGKIVNILDDIAFKGRSMISPERWEQDFLPYYKEINSIISDANMIAQIHSDGDVTELIPSLQKAGFQGLQGWEGGCNPFFISENFPEFVVCGFGDVSEVLPYGTIEQVDTHVKKLMDALKENRCFVLGPSTVIFKEIPLENVKAFMVAAKKYGKY